MLLRELDEQLAATRDLLRTSDQPAESPKALTQVQQQLIRTGLDSQIVAADISRYASNTTGHWKHDVPDFTKVEYPGPSGTLDPPADRWPNPCGKAKST